MKDGSNIFYPSFEKDEKQQENDYKSEQNDKLDEPKRCRSRTLSKKRMARDNRKARSTGELLDIIESWHPTCRSDCHKMARPCLFISCRHHLYLDVNPNTGSVKLNFPDKEIWELEETCALDIAERGGATLEDVGRIMNLTRERIRQLELEGLDKLKHVSREIDGVETYANWDPDSEDDG